jgi:hypothetical protein
MGMRGGAGNPLEGLLSTITGQKQDSKSRSKKKRSSGGPKLEKGLRIVKVKPDGRCLFRALVSFLSSSNPVETFLGCISRPKPVELATAEFRRLL